MRLEREGKNKYNPPYEGPLKGISFILRISGPSYYYLYIYIFITESKPKLDSESMAKTRTNNRPLF